MYTEVLKQLFSKMMSTSRNVVFLFEMDQVNWTTRNWFSCSRNIFRLASHWDHSFKK